MTGLIKTFEHLKQGDSLWFFGLEEGTVRSFTVDEVEHPSKNYPFINLKLGGYGWLGFSEEEAINPGKSWLVNNRCIVATSEEALKTGAAAVIENLKSFISK